MLVQLRLPVLFVMLAVLCAGPVSAQKKKDEDANTRSVQGLVTDSQGAPIASAVVQLKDTKTLQIRSFITSQDGNYHFSGLKTDTDYQLKADNKDETSGWRTLTVFDSRKEPIVNLKVEKTEKK